ncbi:hypothetical protein J3S85_10920 [Streptomyces lavenduligriseus]|nr:hypothetical protein J3S85_10920 [Streptomyces lavenduligriseus]
MKVSGRSRGTSGEWEKPFWQQRGWIVSAGFLLALLALAGVVIATGDDDTGPGDAMKQPTPASSEPSKSSGGQDERPAGCRTDDSDQEKPTAAPSDFTWKANGTGLVPVSRTAGPLKFDGPVWSCFAHTPQGAVMAAHAITDHLSYKGWREVVEKQVVPGPGRDALIASRSKEEDKPLSGKPDAGGYAAYTVLSYNKSETTLMMVLRGPGTTYAATSINMKWHAGDWKLAPEPDGTIYQGMSRVAGTKGFITWEA